MNSTICHLFPAIGEYSVKVINGAIEFAEPIAYPRIISRANNTALTNKTIAEFGLSSHWPLINTTLSGIFLTAWEQFAASASLFPALNSKTGGELQKGQSPWFTNRHIKNFDRYETGQDCGPAWHGEFKMHKLFGIQVCSE